jgi:two-component system, OmpR family, phosphate regulon sensor histidine kinase PhoR
LKIKIQLKLMLSYLILVVVVGAIFYAYLSQTLESQLHSEIRDNLLNETRLARIMAAKEITNLQQDAPHLSRTVGKEIKARVSIITATGTVVGDSELRDAALRSLENHADRPEFLEARAKGLGIATRHSETLGTEMLYVAMPFQTHQGIPGVIRLALPLSRLETAMTSLKTILGIALGAAVICALLLSYILSSITSRPLRTMATAAARIGKGEFGGRLPVTSRDEIGELAAVMNDMAGKLEDQLEKISAERNRLTTILSGMGEGVFVTDTAGSITLANPAFRALFSLTEHVEGKTLIEISRQPSLNNTLMKVLDTREEITEEITIHLPDEKYLLTHWVPLLEDAHLLGVVAVFHDITDLKLLEKIRKDFVANVSHELRTPVSVIKGYAETILNEAQTLPQDKVIHFTGIIYSHAERLANLISDLLTLSRIESGVLSLEPTPTSLDPAISRAIRLLEQKAQEKAVRFIKDESVTRAPEVLADPTKLEQILINLLDNAIKFTPTGGTITVTTEEVADVVRITVKDTGIGIPAKDISRIFERFYRVDTARSRDMGGTGLGLSIVKHLVQAHGGTIHVESTPGKGTIFSFTLKKC